MTEVEEEYEEYEEYEEEEEEGEEVVSGRLLTRLFSLIIKFIFFWLGLNLRYDLIH